MKRLGWGLYNYIRGRLLTQYALGALLALGHIAGSASAQEALPDLSQGGVPLISATPSYATATPCYSLTPCDPVCPTWCDPVCRVPNFFGGFFGTGVGINGGAPTTLAYTGTGAEGGAFVDLVAPITVNGPGGPFVLNNNIPTPFAPNAINEQFMLGENTELTALVQGAFPGATFVDGGAEFFDITNANFFYNYLALSGLTANVNLPNPTGGGLVGRNRYFENGSPIPRDRVFFTYNHVGNYRGMAVPFNVNRYVLGGEKTFFDGNASLEIRVPFAGTADSDQIGNSTGIATATQFGNLGLLLKGVFFRRQGFLASAGFGVSIPTANDSRAFVAGSPFATIDNRTTLLQPIIGCVWAPNDKFYAQSGLQFDFDPTGNPVTALNTTGSLSQIGVLNSQSFSYLDNAIGYWLYENRGSDGLTGVALQSELQYYQSYGSVDRVSNGVISVSDTNGGLNVLNGTTGLIFRFAERANLAVGASYPLGGDRFYDWALQTQFNYQFGR